MDSVTHGTPFLEGIWSVLSFAGLRWSLCLSWNQKRLEIRVVWSIRLTIGSILQEKETATHLYERYMDPRGFDWRVWTDGRTDDGQSITMLNVINQRKCRTQNFVSYSIFIFLIGKGLSLTIQEPLLKVCHRRFLWMEEQLIFSYLEFKYLYIIYNRT